MGKTYRIIIHFNMSNNGVGVFTIKYQKGYTAILLEKEDNRIKYIAIYELLIQKKHIHSNTIGRFYYNPNTFDIINKWMISQINKNKYPIYIDEIGLLEQEKEGFHDSLSKMNNYNHDIYLSVRLSCLNNILNYAKDNGKLTKII